MPPKTIVWPVRKNRAENVMIVTLGRSDLGKVCIPRSIEVPNLFAIEKYPPVRQVVSTVCRSKRADIDDTELLRVCFPGGFATGAPNVPWKSSMTSSPLNVRCPAWLLATSDLTAPWRCPVGAGIVADSGPDAEDEGTREKARAVLHG